MDDLPCSFSFGYELTLLRKFRGTYVKEYHPHAVDEYYDIALKIVDNINSLENSKQIYSTIYNELVDFCCKLIESNKLESAYKHYKDYSIKLAE